MLKSVPFFNLSSIVLIVFTLMGCSEQPNTSPSPPTYQSPLTQAVVENTRLVSKVYSDTLFEVAAGVRETDIYYLSNSGYLTHLFCLTVDLNQAKLTLDAALTPHKKKKKKKVTWQFSLNTVPELANAADSSGHRVLAAVNGDFFKAKAPWGIVVKDGQLLKNSWDMPRSQSFFAILKDGTPLIGDTATFNRIQPRIDDALGACDRLIADGVVLYPKDRHMEPRTAVGIDDSNRVYFMVVDGRSLHYSNGLTCQQMGMLLKACGAKEAVNLDGGGSSTLLIRRPSDSSPWQVRNRPSDGQPRAVSNAWLVIDQATG